MTRDIMLDLMNSLAPGDADDPRPLYGPFHYVKEEDHQWTLEVLNEGGSVSATLTCINPCAIPYCYHTGKLCSCQWVSEQQGDMYWHTVEIPVKLDITPGFRDSYSGEWEAPEIAVVPRGIGGAS